MSSETVLITGASSGIGRELARLFAADHSNLVLVARNQEKLDRLARELREVHGVQVRVLTGDLTDPQSPRVIFDALTAEAVTVDVVVNNAGFGAAGPVVDLPLEKQLDMISVNVAALTHLTRVFLPGMIQRRSGGILNVASTAAFQPGPYMAVYYATKAFVLSFTEALAEEPHWQRRPSHLSRPWAHGDGVCHCGGRGAKTSVPHGDRGRQNCRSGRPSRFSARQIVGHPRFSEQTRNRCRSFHATALGKEDGEAITGLAD